MKRRSSAWPGSGNANPAASNPKVAKKCKMPKRSLMTALMQGLAITGVKSEAYEHFDRHVTEPLRRDLRWTHGLFMGTRLTVHQIVIRTD